MIVLLFSSEFELFKKLGDHRFLIKLLFSKRYTDRRLLLMLHNYMWFIDMRDHNCVVLLLFILSRVDSKFFTLIIIAAHIRSGRLELIRRHKLILLIFIIFFYLYV